ncbi:hypothetical protein DOTSEDRAFT_33396 [Dothistroma septosporum NZE10]|uniref:Uncharacterized protein n=1 Tax=Dothistroma septosporum (strain NZE10 / CBS 128990) TaxID=675120 RepID=N1PXB0_DOTSN|nr:hypothetical protein DOTSEDRAFT_33396 [Dothistroma septosporum NZE10]
MAHDSTNPILLPVLEANALAEKNGLLSFDRSSIDPLCDPAATHKSKEEHTTAGWTTDEWSRSAQKVVDTLVEDARDKPLRVGWKSMNVRAELGAVCRHPYAMRETKLQRRGDGQKELARDQMALFVPSQPTTQPYHRSLWNSFDMMLGVSSFTSPACPCSIRAGAKTYPSCSCKY